MPSPDVPPAADVVGAAKATAAGNKEAAVAAQFGNMTNQVGAKQYSYKIDPDTGEYTFAPINYGLDAKGQTVRSASGVEYTVPDPSNTTDPQQWTQRTVLGANDQQLFNQSQATQMELSKMGLSGLEAVKKAVAQDVTPDIAVRGGPSNTASGMIKNVQGGFIQGGNLDTSGLQRTVSTGALTTQIGTAGGIDNSIINGGSIATAPLFDDRATSTVTNTADKLATSSGATEKAFGLGATSNNADKLTTSLNLDPKLLTQGTTDALYQANTQYLDPQFAQNQAKLESQLANQGITRGSEAYNNAMLNFNNQKQQAYTDARNQAIGQGTAAAQGLFGMGLQGAQFGNTALGQQFGQNVTAQQLANASAQQNNQNAQVNMGLTNQAYGQQFGQNLQAGQFANQATAQNNQQAIDVAQLQNQAQAQKYGQNLSQAEFFNAAQQQKYDQLQSNAQFANAAQQQGYNQEFANTQLTNDVVAQRFGMAQANQQAKNAAEQQTFANAMQNANLTNQQKQALYEQNLASTQLSNQASNQQLAQNQAIQQNPINILQAVRTGAQLNTANLPAVGVSQPGQLANWQGPDMLGAATAQNQYNQGIYNAQAAAQAQMISAGIGAAGALGGAAIKSDRRLKKNIKRIGTHVLGIGLYTWDYLWGQPFSGVMADEVEQVMPEAIVMHPSGFKMVNYEMLGLA